jgi:hypothetical protein
MKRRWFYVLGASCVMALLSTVPMPGQAARLKKEPAAPPAAAPPSTQSAAPAARSLGTIGSWSAYASGDKPGRICYLVGRPQKSDSAGIARKAPVAMVTHRPSENIANVVSFVEGYPLKTGSDAALEVDDKKFDLFTNDDSAWARTAELDRTIVSTLAKGRTATVKGTPQGGKPTTDTYSLAGFGKALALIDEACGVSRPETSTVQAAPAAPTAPAQPAAASAVAAAAAAASAKAATTHKAAARKTSHKKASKKSSKKKKSTQQATQ